AAGFAPQKSSRIRRGSPPSIWPCWHEASSHRIHSLDPARRGVRAEAGRRGRARCVARAGSSVRASPPWHKCRGHAHRDYLAAPRGSRHTGSSPAGRSAPPAGRPFLAALAASAQSAGPAPRHRARDRGHARAHRAHRGDRRNARGRHQASDLGDRSGGPSPRTRLRFARGDQSAQVAGGHHTPGIRAGVVALERRRQAFVSETDFGLRALLGDLEDDVRALPLALVFCEVNTGIQDVPDDLFPGHGFGDLLLGIVCAGDAVGELVAELLGVALHLSRPPSADIADGVEDSFRGLVHGEGGSEIVVLHRSFLLCLWSLCQAMLCGRKPAYWRSNALTTPLRQPSASAWDTGSGKMSSSPFCTPSKIPRATDSGVALGMSNPRFMSVSVGPRYTPCTATHWPAR